MIYNAQTGGFEIQANDLKSASLSLRYALRHVRSLAGLTLDRYEIKGPLSDADHAQKGILDAAAKIGIYMGSEWGNEIDLRER